MIRASKPFRWLISTMVLGLLLLCVGPPAFISAATTEKVTIKVNGEVIKMTEPVYAREGRLYVPAALAYEFGANASWDNDNEELTIHTALNDKVVLGNRVPVVYFNGVRYVMDALPFMADGRLYIPVREFAQILHANLNTNAGGDVLDFTIVKPEVTATNYGWAQISKATGATLAELLERNGLNTNTAVASVAGTKIKVVIPAFFNNPAESYTDTEFQLLAKITMVEAGYEGYEGQLAIANVILNRVKNPKFPDTIRDVIYSGRQFPPAHNGLLDKSKPNASVLRAVKDALNGKNNVGNSVYFFNPNVSKGEFWSSMDVIVTIGHHSFAK
ncbi:spore germination cell wall hydrolase CwlJ-like protein [Paenibacillus phyllosphaerae]|uniref:Spore germination cell wall hydrolase CwlJ-like protein n=1 Tax=Paenibacillus phyllosphaerae TaxID=274593 RepID=A0A7W5FM37_9BACL|nr:cell wall hydrolase [Paenibacillus phyllosphaerae]MBB3109708.1 spore germination cell wall hydrolase CwlJ-like protein [Paenibacillus phyllosphaerae]